MHVPNATRPPMNSDFSMPSGLTRTGFSSRDLVLGLAASRVLAVGSWIRTDRALRLAMEQLPSVTMDRDRQELLIRGRCARRLLDHRGQRLR
jgi:hypothetical protein